MTDSSRTTAPSSAALLEENALAWCEVALGNVAREFPNARFHLARGPEDIPPRPREQFPAFYGSFDWHSCVEMHWVLVRLLRLVPRLVPSDRVSAVLEEHLSAEALATEAKNLPRWERPYGYGWALRLAEELHDLEGDAGEQWAGNMALLCERIAAELLSFLEVAAYPVRSGLHANTAFGLSLRLSWARRFHARLAEAIEVAARRFFGGDLDYPGHYEPSGTDFLSPCLTEAELMLRVLAPSEFDAWFRGYLPLLGTGRPERLLMPVEVADASDGQIAHLHGLNLSRAWCFGRLSSALAAEDERRNVMAAAAERHRDASLREAVGSDYMVEHWLAAYALLLVTEA